MTNIIDIAIKSLEEKLLGKNIDFSAKFEIENEGSILVDSSGIRVSSEEADCTLIASAETFQDIMSGETNPTSAFMNGSLKVEGSMGVAMQLGNILG
ncbi:MAG: SCP2 sterol-binding domain-containing protein [Pseudomonadota bacterium]|nr:SCP2 sterol-binding domain-containing protein [Pseudomonadota bacterium]